MYKITVPFLLILVVCSCTPFQTAPTIDDYQITKGAQLKEGLPEKNLFVFEDPKDANEFYNYINTKFNLENYYVDVEVPFNLDGRNYFLSFYEVEMLDRTVDTFGTVLGIIAGEELEEEPEEFKHYIAIEVFSSIENDCLKETYPSRESIVTHLNILKNEYLNGRNWNRLVR
ncbi:hypothetical protein KIM67_02610 [Flagellimonas sp. 389]|uniref:hypothetical protein n=1 Tax=Flagellimonas sp. 389 TaxID=2835862 RepID=UPI001BD5AC51|nr:hypothetical protein [Flagellimonas sp. 389]MBS9461288.1 hypothetical protein [Flagellimonas sp. 389]